jgi:hypothetical protein
MPNSTHKVSPSRTNRIARPTLEVASAASSSVDLTNISEPSAATGASSNNSSIAESEAIVEAARGGRTALAASVLGSHVGGAQDLVGDAVVVADCFAVVGGAGGREAGGVGGDA